MRVLRGGWPLSFHDVALICRQMGMGAIARVVAAPSIVLGFCIAIASGYRNSDTLTCTYDLAFLLKALQWSIILFVVFTCLVLLFKRLAVAQPALLHRGAGVLFDDKWGCLHQVIRLALPMTILWFPYLVALYPGNLSTDTTGQLAMFFALFDDSSDIRLSNHHPIFDTMVFGGFMYGANCVFHNLHMALASLIALQLFCIAVSVSFALTVLVRRIGCQTWACGLAWLVFALFPLFPILGCTLSKDTFFIWLFIGYFALLADMFSREMRMSVGLVAALTVCGILLALTKQLGVYIFLGSMFLCLVFGKARLRQRTVLLFPMAVVAVLMFALMPALLASASIAPSGKQEKLSVPLQQSALTYIRHGDEMSAEELKILDDALYPPLDQVAKVYDPYNADYVKGFGPEGRTFEGYLSLWAAQALRYPTDYADAWLTLESPLLSYAVIRLLFTTTQHSWDPGYFKERFYGKPAFSEAASSWLDSVYKEIAHLPVVTFLFMPTVYVVIIPVAYAVCVVCRRAWNRNDLLMLAPLLLAFLGLLVSPVVRESYETMRYFLPFVFSAPLLLTLCVKPDMQGTACKTLLQESA